MKLCQRCRRSKATVQLAYFAGNNEKANGHLCGECAQRMQARLDASRQGPQPCAFCGETAFTPLPVVRDIIYACCGCRSRYSEIFMDLCAYQRPNVHQRGQRDITFFDWCFEVEIEGWAEDAGKKAMEELKGNGPRSQTN